MVMLFTPLSNKRSGLRNHAVDIELNLAWQLDDCFGIIAILEQRVFEGLRSIDEQAAKEAVLFLGDPVASSIAADEDDGANLGTPRGRFDEFHVQCPSRRPRCAPRRDGFAHAMRNIRRTG
jgi:hypothetical protein